tara:strand:- start:29 stop:1306 length:1278 start_codon:yes stop_codon:yes gene_type:complete
MNLRFNSKNYFDHQWKFLTEKKPNGDPYKIKGLVGGFGSGKTYIFIRKVLHCHITKVNSEGKSNGWIIYPTYDLSEELFIQPFIGMLQEYNIDYEYNIAKHRITTGYGTIKVYQLQAPQRIIGASLNYIGFDEFDVESWKNCDVAFKKAIGRMRGSEDTEIFIVTSPEGYHYTHKIFVEDDNDDRFLVHGKTTDNNTLPESYIRLLESTYPKPLLDAYRDGKFVNLTALSTYYNFRRKDHVKKVKYNPNLPIHIGMDFNLFPITCTLLHYSENSNPKVQVFDEIELHYGGGNEILTETLIREIKSRYPNKRYIAYPDPAGKSKSTSSLHSDHDLLRRASFELRVKPAAPRVVDSVNAVNKAFEKDIAIDPKCKGLITDLEQVTNLPNSRQINKKDSNRTHFTDGFRYFVDYCMPIIKPQFGSIPR